MEKGKCVEKNDNSLEILVQGGNGGKIDCKLTGPRVVWFAEVTLQVEILKLKEGNTTQPSKGFLNVLCVHLNTSFQILNNVIFFAEIVLHKVSATLGKQPALKQSSTLGSLDLLIFFAHDTFTNIPP